MEESCSSLTKPVKVIMCVLYVCVVVCASVRGCTVIGVSLCAYMYVCVCVYVHVCLLHVNVHVGVCLYVSTFVVCVCLYVCTFVVCVWLYMCACMCMLVCVWLYMHARCSVSHTCVAIGVHYVKVSSQRDEDTTRVITERGWTVIRGRKMRCG